MFPYNDPGQLPITPLRQPNGEWLRLEIALPGYSVWLRAWQVQVGRVKLYLLDSNDAANYPAHRGITSELYGGGPELRLQARDAPGDRRMAAAACAGDYAGGMSSERRARGVRGARACPRLHGRDRAALRRGSRRDARRQSSSPPTPRWRLALIRFAPDLIEQYLGRIRRAEARDLGLRSSGSRPPESRRQRRSLSIWRIWRFEEVGQ